MIYKTFEEWKAGQWLEDGEPRTKAYTEDELLLVEMGWQYGFDAGKEVKDLTDEEIDECSCFVDVELSQRYGSIESIDDIDWTITGLRAFARAILRKASEKC